MGSDTWATLQPNFILYPLRQFSTKGSWVICSHLFTNSFNRPADTLTFRSVLACLFGHGPCHADSSSPTDVLDLLHMMILVGAVREHWKSEGTDTRWPNPEGAGVGLGIKNFG